MAQIALKRRPRRTFYPSKAQLPSVHRYALRGLGTIAEATGEEPCMTARKLPARV
jgi:hypothetical protein